MFRGILPGRNRFSADASPSVKNAAGGVKNAGGGGVSRQHPHHWYESLQAMSATLIAPFKAHGKIAATFCGKSIKSRASRRSSVNLYDIVQSGCFTCLAQARVNISTRLRRRTGSEGSRGMRYRLASCAETLLDNALKYTRLKARHRHRAAGT